MADNPVIAHIQPNRGEEYALHSDLSISRPKIGMGPGGGWKAVALFTVRGGYYQYAMSIGSLLELLRRGEMRMAADWLYKNGKPRYYLADLDHGSNRIQGGGLRWITLARA